MATICEEIQAVYKKYSAREMRDMKEGLLHKRNPEDEYKRFQEKEMVMADLAVKLLKKHNLPHGPGIVVFPHSDGTVSIAVCNTKYPGGAWNPYNRTPWHIFDIKDNLIETKHST